MVKLNRRIGCWEGEDEGNKVGLFCSEVTRL
jgi:hypothetical protein